MSWTYDEEIALSRMAVEEDRSASYIASALGKTRNAIIGKIHRLNLKWPNGERSYCSAGPGKKRERPKGEARARRIVDKAKRARMPVVSEFVAPVLSFENKQPIGGLSDCTCRWPLWNDDGTGERFFCGSPEADMKAGRPYCQWHTFLSRPDHAEAVQ